MFFLAWLGVTLLSYVRIKVDEVSSRIIYYYLHYHKHQHHYAILLTTTTAANTNIDAVAYKSRL
jgi:hypothetical protein